jgi:hypothetical protein
MAIRLLRFGTLLATALAVQGCVAARLAGLPETTTLPVYPKRTSTAEYLASCRCGLRFCRSNRAIQTERGWADSFARSHAGRGLYPRQGFAGCGQSPLVYYCRARTASQPPQRTPDHSRDARALSGRNQRQSQSTTCAVVCWSSA